MSVQRIREDWLRVWAEADHRNQGAKSSQDALNDLFGAYRALSPAARDVVDQLLTETLASRDESLRFDALALINEFRITSALPGLRDLEMRLRNEASPGAPFEVAKVGRLIARLSQP